MANTMNPEIKARWTAALRSGEYEQGWGYLNADGKLCCLGVLCELAVKDEVIIPCRESSRCVYYDGEDDVLPPSVRLWAGLPDRGENPDNPNVTVDDRAVSLAELNDGENGWERHSFDQIADIIDAQL